MCGLLFGTVKEYASILIRNVHRHNGRDGAELSRRRLLESLKSTANPYAAFRSKDFTSPPTYSFTST